MTRRRLDIGLWGEEVAVSYFLRHGYMVIARRWRVLRGDIDLIVQKDGQVVFVEVKTRIKGAGKCGTPEESVTPAKQRQLIRLATVFLARMNSCIELSCRIDVVAIEKDVDRQVAHLRHYANAVMIS